MTRSIGRKAYESRVIGSDLHIPRYVTLQHTERFWEIRHMPPYCKEVVKERIRYMNDLIACGAVDNDSVRRAWKTIENLKATM